MERSSATNMESPHLLVVVLYVNEGQEAAFAQFEAIAADIMRSHGGRIARAVRCAEVSSGARAPYEIHLVEFPSEEAFLGYRRDSRLAAHSGLRAQAICKTEIWTGWDVDPPALAVE
jgi:uncharacterized protein (DUF1330 family)